MMHYALNTLRGRHAGGTFIEPCHSFISTSLILWQATDKPATSSEASGSALGSGPIGAGASSAGALSTGGGGELKKDVEGAG